MTPLFVLLAIDVFNGVFALIAEGPATLVALVLKLMVLLYVAWKIAWTPRIAALVLAIAALLVAGLALVDLERESLQLFAKSAATLVLASLLHRYSQRIAPKELTRLLRSVLLVIAASLMLGLLGFGHDRYADSAALLTANGFLPAGNEINIVLIGIFWWLSARLRAGHHRLDDLALCGLCIALLALSGSKTTIAGALVIALYHTRLRAGPAVLLGIAVAVSGYLLINSVIWERWVHFYFFYLDEGVLSALTNGRFGRVEDFIGNWRDVPWLGVGVLARGGGYIESDPLDLALNFGLLGVLLFMLYARITWVVCQSRCVPWLLIIGASSLAGHVIYSVFAAPLLVAAFTGAPLRRHRPPVAARSRENAISKRISARESPIT